MLFALSCFAYFIRVDIYFYFFYRLRLHLAFLSLELILFEECIHEFGGVNSDLLSHLVESFFDFVLAFDSLLLHLFLNFLELFFLLCLEACLLLVVLLLCCKGELDLESLLDLRHCFILSLGVLFQELFNFLVLLLLELLKFALGLIDYFLDSWIDHHLLHFEAHFRLEAETAKIALCLANCQLVVLHLRYRLAARCGVPRLAARLIQEPHNLALARELHREIVMGVQLVQ